MIKANELRIGNLIKYGVHTAPVLSIFNGTSGNVKSDNPYVCLPFPGEIRNLYEIEPIPLSSEILEKCGLINNEVFPAIEYFSIKDGSLYFERNYTAVNIEYLHQLQNLYFALTGEELVINLTPQKE